jgi:hypothetical protein
VGPEGCLRGGTLTHQGCKGSFPQLSQARLGGIAPLGEVPASKLVPHTGERPGRGERRHYGVEAAGKDVLQEVGEGLLAARLPALDTPVPARCNRKISLVSSCWRMTALQALLRTMILQRCLLTPAGLRSGLYPPTGDDFVGRVKTQNWHIHSTRKYHSIEPFKPQLAEHLERYVLRVGFKMV